METRVTTETGSVYVVREEDGRFFMAADNVPNWGSIPLQDGAWEIAPPTPWPPQLGMGLALLSIHFDDKQHPDRIPGGGKYTSPVRTVEVTP